MEWGWVNEVQRQKKKRIVLLKTYMLMSHFLTGFHFLIQFPVQWSVYLAIAMECNPGRVCTSNPPERVSQTWHPQSSTKNPNMETTITEI